jgi:adenylate cyclase
LAEVATLSVRPRQLHALALLLPLLLVMAWATTTQPLALMDAQFHDQITRSLPAQPASAEVVLVDVDEASLAQLGPWPWPRPLVAELSKRLRERGARLQVWDLYFPESKAADDVLVVAMTGGTGGARSSDVVIGQVPILDPKVQSPPRLGALRPSESVPDLCAAGPAAVLGHFGVADSLMGIPAGHITSTPDLDGALRRLPAVICDGVKRYPQLSLVAAELHQPRAPWVLEPGGPVLGPTRWLTRGELRFALDSQGDLLVPYRRPHHQWPAVSALRLLEAPAQAPTHRPEEMSFKGKVVVIGATALGLVDTVSTPFHAKAPGVSVHAELISAALSGRWAVAPARPALYVLLVGALLGAVLTVAMRRPLMLFSAGAAVALAPVALAALARTADHMLPAVSLSFGLAAFAFVLGLLQVEASRRQVRVLARHLESFLPRNLALEIARQNPSGDSLGRPESGVVLAIRVVGLERWSSAEDSLKALGLVHAVSTLAEKHSRLHGGNLEHLQGETLLLAWSTPASAGGDASRASAPEGPSAQARVAVQQAILAARGLLVELGALLGSTESERYPLGLRAAVEAGPYLLAVAGSSNSRRSLMLGPAVDVALALLPLCDELASPLLMGQRAAALQPRVPTHPMGQFLLPDSGHPQTVYRVEP